MRLSNGLVSRHSPHGHILDGEDFLDGDESLAVARSADARGDPVSVPQEVVALKVRGKENVLRKGAKIVARPAEETAPLRCHLDDPIGKKHGAASGVGAEDIEDEVMPCFIRIPSHTDGIGAVHQFLDRLGVEFVDPKFCWHRDWSGHHRARGGCRLGIFFVIHIGVGASRLKERPALRGWPGWNHSKSNGGSGRFSPGGRVEPQ